MQKLLSCHVLQRRSENVPKRVASIGIPQEMVGRLIGPKGSNIIRLRQTTGVAMQLCAASPHLCCAACSHCCDWSSVYQRVGHSETTAPDLTPSCHNAQACRV